MVVGRPQAALSPYVDRYVGYRQDRLESGKHQGLPSRSMTLIVSLADPIRMLSMPDPAQPPAAFTGLIGGLHAGPVTVAADRFQYGVQAALTPWAAGALLGHPAGVLAGGVYDIADVLGARGRELLDRVREAPDWTSRFAAFDLVLSACADQARTPRPEVREAWTELVRSGGRVSVHELATRVGWSRRHLGDRFRRDLGLTPKTAARVIRFERSHRAMTSRACSGLAEVAAECGFADQAHMTREWRDLAAQTPSAWTAAELPFAQEAANDPETASVHV